MTLLAFRRGLWASELCELQWSDVEFESGTLQLRRANSGNAIGGSAALRETLSPSNIAVSAHGESNLNSQYDATSGKVEPARSKCQAMVIQSSDYGHLRE
jgi:hypothetical protein